MSTPSPDAPLRHDVRLLGETLGRVLVEQGGEGLLADEERVRELSRRARTTGSAAARSRLAAAVTSLPLERQAEVLRAFSLYFQLANLAEQHHRLRRRRQYEHEERTPRESLADAFARLERAGIGKRRLTAAADRISLELVLTAHPTEATRRSVLDHQLRVAKLLDGLDDPRIGRSRRRALLSELREALTIWWQTDEVRRVRPMVEDEVRRNLFFFEATLHDAVPEVLEELERCFEVRVDGRELAFGSWAGSDMDGHPEVGAETLARTLTLHRQTALRLLRAKVDRLAQHFSHSSRRVPVSPALEASL
jgi:phosphoenolpyruvate carboxylase